MLTPRSNARRGVWADGASRFDHEAVSLPERTRQPSDDIRGCQPAMSIGHLIETYGYVAVFLLVAVESLGIPVPGETALIVADT